jgi:tetratricopeptide (TPR) repeat protein
MWIRKAFVGASLVGALQAAAETPQNISRGEVARLPEYCRDTQTFELRGSRDGPTERQRRWVTLVGDSFWGLHHYCWALISANRAELAGVTPAQRAHLLNSAIADCYYVIDLAPPDMPLLPEIYLRVAQYQLALGRMVDSMQHFERSRQLKPDYWPAYVGLADLNAGLGRREQALQVLDEGLKLMPDEQRLRDARDRIKSLKSKADTPSPAKRAKAASGP